MFPHDNRANAAVAVLVFVAGCRLVSLPAGTCGDNSACFVGEICCLGACVAAGSCTSADAGADGGDAGPDASADAGADAGTVWTIVCNWGTASRIGSSSGGYGNTPLAQVASGPNGEAAVVYSQPDGSAWEVYAVRAAPDGGSWSAPQLLGSNPNAKTTPSVVIDWTGTATAVWGITTGGPYCLAHSRFRSSDYAWQGAVESATGYSMPVIVHDGAGWITAISNNGANYYAHQLDPDASAFSPLDTIGPHPYTGDPGHAAKNASGFSVFVTRKQIVAGKRIVWASSHAQGIGWGSAVTISEGDGGDFGNPVAAIDDVGNAMAVWTQPVDAGTYDVYWNWKPTDAGWATPQPIQAVPVYSRRDPFVSARAAGWFYVTWTEAYDEMTNQVRSAQFRPGIGWGDAGKVSGNGGAALARVGTDAVGNARFAWNEWNGGNRIAHRRFAPNGEWWTDPATLNGIDAGVLSHELDVAPTGYAALVWIEEVAPYQYTVNAALCR